MHEPDLEKVEGTIITLIKSAGVIQAVQIGNVILNRKQEVVSNGRFVPATKKGVIEGFLRPYQDGVTSNFIEVMWEGDTVVTHMKLKDLVL
jgi:hypothetical protein